MLLVIDNYDSFTFNLVQRLGEADPALSIHVARNDELTPDAAEGLDGGRGPSHLIISPGPCTPREAGCSAAMIERFTGRIPILGVCLGHQTIAHVYGLRVERHARPVHGKASLVHHDGRGLFRDLPNPLRATRYHSLVVAPESIPPLAADGSGWVVSAWTDEPVGMGNALGGADSTRRVVMGLRRVWAHGQRLAPLDGVQFHPESFLTAEGPRLLANFLRSAHRNASATDAETITYTARP